MQTIVAYVKKYQAYATQATMICRLQTMNINSVQV